MTRDNSARIRRLSGALALTVIAAFLPALAVAEAVTIRVGRGSAAEEQLWLMQALPKVTPHQGKAYKMEMTLFRGTDQRFQAYEADALDAMTGSANSAIFAASEGVKMKAVASISRETKKGFHTQYMVQADSPIKTVKDLQDKLIGVNGLKSSIHLWASIVVEEAGLDPAKDVRFVPVPFPAQGEALRAGKIAVGAFPQPFAFMEQKKGGLRTLFTSKDAVPFDEELILFMFRPAFIEEHPDAVRAFLSDLVAATKFYEEHRKEAQQALIDAKLTRIAPEVYFEMQDYERALDAKVDIESLKKMQELQIKTGFQDKKADIDALVDNSYLPN